VDEGGALCLVLHVCMSPERMKEKSYIDCLNFFLFFFLASTH